MKVLFVAPSYHPHIGGVEYVVKSIAERLAKAHEVTVVAGEPYTDNPKEEIINGVKVVRWPVWSPGNAYHIPRRRSDLEKLLREQAIQADVTHIHSVHCIFTVHAGLIIASSTASPKIVVTPHYHGTGHTVLRKVLWLPWRQRVAELLKKAVYVQAVSNREASLLAIHYPRIRGKIVVIPNGIDEDVLNYTWQGQTSDYMIYAGRIERYKRLQLAINIAKELKLKLLVVGNGPYRDKLAKYANSVYNGRVEFLEPQPREKYLDLVSKATYAVNPSKHEAYSIFTAEALAIGTPAITTREIAENLEARTKPFIKDLVRVETAPIKTWSEVLLTYAEELYKSKRRR
ncbi:MAG: glycosyltransferase [Desulfurococcales archaeon]|nr:glycosyltransferase [Desulfurococcales archaeon]